MKARYELKDSVHPTWRGGRFSSLKRAEKALAESVPPGRFFIKDHEGDDWPTFEADLAAAFGVISQSMAELDQVEAILDKVDPWSVKATEQFKAAAEASMAEREADRAAGRE